MLQRKKKTTSEDKQEYVEPIIPLNFNNEKKNMAQSIIINLGEPEKKKKKKKQKKKQNFNKSEELNKNMKSLYQQTLTRYIQGNYPPLTNIPDIRNITNNDLLNMVNEMKIKLKEPVVAPSILTETTSESAIPAMAQPRAVLTETTSESAIPAMAEVPISETQLSPPKPILTKTTINKGSAEQISLDEQKSFILFSYFNNYIQNHFDINPNNDEIELLEAYNFYFINKDLFDNLNNDDKNLYLNKYIDNTYSNLSDTEKNDLFLMYSDCFTVVKSTELFNKSKKLNFTSSEVGNKKISSDDIEIQKKLKEEKVVLADEVDFLLNLVEELNKDKETLTQTQQDILNESEELKNNIKKLNDEEIKKYISINKDLQTKLDETIKKLNTKNQSDLKDKIAKIEIQKRLSKAFNPEETKPKPVLTQTTQAQGSAPSMVFGGGGGGFIGAPISGSSGGSSISNQGGNSGFPSSGSDVESINSAASLPKKGESSGESVYLIEPETEKFVINNYDNNYNYIGEKLTRANKTSIWVPLGNSIGELYNRQNDKNSLINLPTTFINDFKKYYLQVEKKDFNIEEEKLRIQAEEAGTLEAGRPEVGADIRPMSAQEAGLGIQEGGASSYPLFIACMPTRRSSDDTSTDPANLDNTITDEELSSSTISDSKKVCKRVTREDVILLNKLEADNDLNKLQILYKKYYNKNFKYALNRTDEGKLIDIVYSFKNNGKIRPTEKELSTIPDKNLLPKYYQYLNELSTNNELLELTNEYIIATGDDTPNNDSNEIKIKKIKDLNYIPTVARNRNFFAWLNNNPNPITTPAILQSDADLLIKYRAYLNDLASTDSKTNLSQKEKDKFLRLLDNIYMNVFKVSIIPETLDTPDLVTKIIENQYIPKKNVEIDKDFFDWLENPTPATPTPTPTPSPTPDPTFNKPQEKPKLTISDNEVELCFEVNKAVYLEPSRRERIAQLDYDDTLSNVEVAIYRDLYTQIIYFCSRGSQTAEDWLKSDLAIVFGAPTVSYSPRLNNEITILNQVLSIYRPTTIIYTGHSLGGYISNELFIYTLKEVASITQAFSIGFNGGQGLPAYYRNNPFDDNFINTHVLQFHVKGDALSLTQTYAPFGTLVNVPVSSLLIIPNHFLSVYGAPNLLEPYKNFVDNGLKIQNPDQVTEEDTSATTTKSTEIEQRFINFLGQLYELDDNERYNRKTLRYINTAFYYDENKEYLNNIDMIAFIDKNITDDNQSNFYKQIYQDLKNDRYPREVLGAEPDPEPQPEPQPQPQPEPQPEPQPQPPPPPEPYQTPIGGLAGAVAAGGAGFLASGGNPIVAGGTAAVGFLAGNAIEKALPPLPDLFPKPPPRPIYVPPPPKTQLNPFLFGGGKTGGKKFNFPFP